MVWRSQIPCLLQKSIWYALTPGDIRDNLRSPLWGIGVKGYPQMVERYTQEVPPKHMAPEDRVDQHLLAIPPPRHCATNTTKGYHQSGGMRPGTVLIKEGLGYLVAVPLRHCAMGGFWGRGFLLSCAMLCHGLLNTLPLFTYDKG